MYDYVVFIGRFQPFHAGHQEVLEKAKKLGKRVIVLVGSSFQPRTIKNPWSFDERRAMITASFPDAIICPLRDVVYNDQHWAKSVQALVGEAVLKHSGWTDKPPSTALIGHSKDESSYYLQMFPQWELIEHEMNESIDATKVRELYFSGESLKFLEAAVPPTTLTILDIFKKTSYYNSLKEEFEFIKEYRRQWQGTPYPVQFLTVDAVVVQSGHVLLIKRRGFPGRGQLALPGGFVGINERCEEAALRELEEETKIKVPSAVLKGSIKAQKLFDAPNRSLRGRTVTEAFLIELKAGALPKVKGSDDAESAKWIPLNDLREEEMYEDHYHIINNLLGLI